MGEVAIINPRRSPDLDDATSVSFVPMSAVSEVSGTIESKVVRPVREVRRGFTQFVDGDVLFAKITPSMENGKSAVARKLVNGVGYGSTEFHVLRSKGAVLPEYLWHFIRQVSFRSDAQIVMSGAVGQQRVPASFLKKYLLPLAPLSEQKRIVLQMDRLLQRVTQAESILQGITPMLERYRTTMFAKAFSGALTEEFRGERIVRGALPRGWVVRPLGEISEIQGGTQVGKKRGSEDLVEVPYLRVANVQRGWLALEDVKKIAVSPIERDRLLLKAGDVLMNEGGDRDKLGRGWVWEGQIPDCIHQNHVFRIRLHEDLLPPKFVSHFANEQGQQYFFSQGVQTTNLASISKSRVAALPVPIPSYGEAAEILRRIERELSWMDRLESQRTAALGLLQRLRASIAARAFAGGISTQLPDDEPVGTLLSRLSALPLRKELEPMDKLPRRTRVIAEARSIETVLSQEAGWLPAQEAFRRCGIADGATTEQLEVIFRELRALLATGRLESEPILDEVGRKIADRLRIRGQ